MLNWSNICRKSIISGMCVKISVFSWPPGGACTPAISFCSFCSFIMNLHPASDTFPFTLLLKGHVPVHNRLLRLFFHISHDCLRRSCVSDLLAQWKCSFSWTRSLTAVKLSSLHPLLHLHPRHSFVFVLHSLTSCPVFGIPNQTAPRLPLPTLPLGPQRWRADSYNYPSVCEMNHWVADWAAWWETSILSGSTECAPSSLSLMPGCWHATAEGGRVWSAARVCCGKYHVTETCLHQVHQCRNMSLS